MSGSGLTVPASTDERVVAEFFASAQIVDCGSMIRVRFEGKPPAFVKRDLRDIGFEGGPNETLQRRSSPQAIFDTQAVLRDRYGSERQVDEQSVPRTKRWTGK